MGNANWQSVSGIVTSVAQHLYGLWRYTSMWWARPRSAQIGGIGQRVHRCKFPTGRLHQGSISCESMKTVRPHAPFVVFAVHILTPRWLLFLPVMLSAVAQPSTCIDLN